MNRTSILSTVLLRAAALFAQAARAQDYNCWNLPDGALMRLGKGDVLDVVWSPDGTRLAVGGSRDDPVRLWDVATGQVFIEARSRFNRAGSRHASHHSRILPAFRKEVVSETTSRIVGPRYVHVRSYDTGQVLK